MTAYKDFLAEMFDLDQPEYVKEATVQLSQKLIMTRLLIKSNSGIDRKVIEKLLDMGQTVSDKDRDAIIKGVMPEN